MGPGLRRDRALIPVTALDSCSTERYYSINQMRAARTPRQLHLPIPHAWGGRRPGAGRKPGPRPVTPHRARPVHGRGHPVHATLRARREVGSLRTDATFLAVRAALAQASRTDFRVVHFSVQRDHVHLLVEARSREALSSGMRGLAIRVALAVNRVLVRKGRVWADRWHGRALTTPREVRAALVYVLMNVRSTGPSIWPRWTAARRRGGSRDGGTGGGPGPGLSGGETTTCRSRRPRPGCSAQGGAATAS